jgi:hypothetical protein
MTIEMLMFIQKGKWREEFNTRLKFFFFLLICT